MLDAETKRRIDTARDVLVGKLPDPMSQVEQITIALIYKFMDDMDAEAEEMGGTRTFFSGEFERYGWAKLMDVSLGGNEMLNRYAEGIEKMNQNPNIPAMFRNIFKNAFLPYRDPETLKLFLRTINGFYYDHSERLGDAFEYLLSIMASQGDAGQFRTPRHIIDFMVSLVDPKKEERVLDPACGTAGFLISAYRHIMAAERENAAKGEGMTPEERGRLMSNFEGYDISPDMVRLSLVNMYLHGFTTPKIYEYDTLTSEERWGDFADVILANPPFMSPKGGIRPHRRFAVESNRSEVLFVDYIMEHLTPNGRAAVIVPEGIIFQGGKAYKALRKKLVEEDYLVGVISLPAGVFNPYSGVKTSILWMDKALAKRSDMIVFCKVEHDGFDLGAQRRPNGKDDFPGVVTGLTEYKNCLAERREFEIEGFRNVSLVEKNRLSEGGEYNLNVERYSILENKSVSINYKKIGEVCDIVTGSTPLKSDSEYWSEGTIPWFTIDDLRNQGRIINVTNQFITEKALKETSIKLVPKDSVLICCTASVGATAYANIQLTTNQQFNSLIINDYYKDRLLPKFLLILSTHFIEDLLKLGGTTAFKFVSIKDLKTIKIPVPPVEVQEDIVSEIEGYQKIIDGARMVVENYRPRIEVDPNWPVVKLGEVCEVVTDGSHFSPPTTETGYPYVTVKDIKEGKIDLENCKRIDKENYELLVKNGCKPSIKDILFSKDGTVGKTAYVEEDKDFVVLSSLAIIRPAKAKVNEKFLYFLLSTDNFINKAISNKTGVAIKRIVLKTLKIIEIAIPDKINQELIVNKLEEEERMIDSTKKLISIYEEKIRARIAKVWGE